MDASGTKVWCLFTQTIENFFHTPISFDLTMSTLLYLTETPDGKKLISKQVDFHSFESILYRFPLLGKFLEWGFRGFTSWQIIRPAAFIGKIWTEVETALRGVPVVDRNWDLLVKRASSLWWRKERKFCGRKLAPYDPSL